MPGQLSGAYLAVDDEESMRGLIAALLETAGATCFCASNREEALGMAERQKAEIKAILLDLNLGDTSGEALFDELSAGHPELPIFIMSGSGDSEIAERLGARPIAGLVNKPFSYANLIEKLAI